VLRGAVCSADYQPSCLKLCPRREPDEPGLISCNLAEPRAGWTTLATDFRQTCILKRAGAAMYRETAGRVARWPTGAPLRPSSIVYYEGSHLHGQRARHREPGSTAKNKASKSGASASGGRPYKARPPAAGERQDLSGQAKPAKRWCCARARKLEVSGAQNPLRRARASASAPPISNGHSLHPDQSKNLGRHPGRAPR